MVVALGPGKFYGSSLPRPRFYTDVKFNDERVDPPTPVMDPLMAWAEEAHWSMGGLNFKRHRLQGRIEGNIQRLRTQREQTFKRSQKQDNKSSRVSETSSPQPPPVAIKRRRVVGLVDEEEEVEVTKKGPVRKLGDDFERVARESGIENSSGGESGGAVAARTRGKKNEAVAAVDEGNMNKRRKLVKGGRKIGVSMVAAAVETRSSPRLAKSSGST
ncbi:hypothetical protein PHJA_000783000 [Phtheirospermum japonicum]|uniref:Uncharacterized protein n=1 Tax=Phtheirospermum japonicum TaxID=374723 RepID=A0A830BJN0_9LAMI|nr:hypothetical protein PHJA_000783000 [Phtheirospermum japonicum]